MQASNGVRHNELYLSCLFGINWMYFLLNMGFHTGDHVAIKFQTQPDASRMKLLVCLCPAKMSNFVLV